MEPATDKKAEYPHKGISLPACSANKDCIFHNPAEVSKWLEDVPLASPLESARLIFKSLFDMNRTQLDSDNRINGLETLLGPVTLFTQSLITRYNSTTFPMSEKNYKIAQLVREIFREMFIGYKHVLSEHIDKSEVEYLITCSIKELIRMPVSQTSLSILNQEYKVPYFDIENEMVWGATAMILNEFLEILKKVPSLNKALY